MDSTLCSRVCFVKGVEGDHVSVYVPALDRYKTAVWIPSRNNFFFSDQLDRLNDFDHRSNSK